MGVVAKKETTNATTTNTTEEKKTVEKEPVMYMGPDVKFKGSYIMNGTTFTNGLPNALEEFKKEVPVVSRLIVPISKLAETGAEIAKSGSVLNKLYAMAKDIAEEKNKKEEEE